MGTIKTEYKSFLDDIEKNIKDKDDLEYIKKRFASFVDVMLDQIDYILDYKKKVRDKKIDSNIERYPKENGKINPILIKKCN